jgi:hypothetical protein
MNGRKITRGGVKSGVAALALASFALLLAPADASGQIWRGDRAGWRGERAESRSVRRIAEAQGYNDGLREGANQLRQRKRHNPYGEGKYKKGTNGYKLRFGDKTAYRRIYRQAFVRGYNEAYFRDARRARPLRRIR